MTSKCSDPMSGIKETAISEFVWEARITEADITMITVSVCEARVTEVGRTVYV